MEGKFLLPSNTSDVDSNIFANKSSLILYWLLLEGVDQGQFSIREVAKKCNLSVGLVQRVFKMLTLKGYIVSKGLRTSKKFILKKPNSLLKSWIDNYNITEKCKMRTYRSGIQSKEKIFKALIENNLQKNVVLALHTATDAYGYKNTNLNTIELYILNADLRLKIEEKLLLEPQEKGYEILLIEPYYKSMLNSFSQSCKLLNKYNFLCPPILLTYLDLYNFPLRGNEQAQFMAERIESLKKIFKK